MLRWRLGGGTRGGGVSVGVRLSGDGGWGGDERDRWVWLGGRVGQRARQGWGREQAYRCVVDEARRVRISVVVVVVVVWVIGIWWQRELWRRYFDF